MTFRRTTSTPSAFISSSVLSRFAAVVKTSPASSWNRDSWLRLACASAGRSCVTAGTASSMRVDISVVRRIGIGGSEQRSGAGVADYAGEVSVRPLHFENGELNVLDQTLLPHEERWVRCSSA